MVLGPALADDRRARRRRAVLAEATSHRPHPRPRHGRAADHARRRRPPPAGQPRNGDLTDRGGDLLDRTTTTGRLPAAVRRRRDPPVPALVRGPDARARPSRSSLWRLPVRLSSPTSSPASPDVLAASAGSPLADGRVRARLRRRRRVASRSDRRRHRHHRHRRLAPLPGPCPGPRPARTPRPPAPDPASTQEPAMFSHPDTVPRRARPASRSPDGEGRAAGHRHAARLRRCPAASARSSATTSPSCSSVVPPLAARARGRPRRGHDRHPHPRGPPARPVRLPAGEAAARQPEPADRRPRARTAASWSAASTATTSSTSWPRCPASRSSTSPARARSTPPTSSDPARRRHHRTCVVTGVTTEVCVHTTVREANDRGYDCLVLVRLRRLVLPRVPARRPAR